MTLACIKNGIYKREDADCLIDGCDSIIFDCDGVLIDVSKSYDMAIDSTVRHILGEFGINKIIHADQYIIQGFKRTGGFNDEVDLTYGIILGIAAANALHRDQREFLLDVIANSDESGISSVQRYVKSMADISSVIEWLDYPGTHAQNILYRTFDQIFYGTALYKKIYNVEPAITGPGLINQDVLLVNANLLDILEKRFAAMALVTGRGMVPARYSLGSLLDRFDPDSSMFLEDHPRSLAKPNPESLLRVMDNINSESCMYVGDSMEDLIMAKRAGNLGRNVVFCGILGNNPERLPLFERGGAQLAIESTSMLPKVLNLE